MDGEDVAAITQRLEELQQASMKLGEEVYKAQQAEAEDDDAGPDGGADNGDAGDNSTAQDDVVDADFEEVDNQNQNKTA